MPLISDYCGPDVIRRRAERRHGKRTRKLFRTGVVWRRAHNADLKTYIQHNLFEKRTGQGVVGIHVYFSYYFFISFLFGTILFFSGYLCNDIIRMEYYFRFVHFSRTNAAFCRRPWAILYLSRKRYPRRPVWFLTITTIIICEFFFCLAYHCKTPVTSSWEQCIIYYFPLKIFWTYFNALTSTGINTHIHKTVTHVNASQKQMRKRACFIIFGFNSYKKTVVVWDF